MASSALSPAGEAERLEAVRRYRILDTPAVRKTPASRSSTASTPNRPRQSGGSGLGLLIAKRLTGELGGTIGLDRSDTIRTTFFVEIPSSL